MIKIIIISKKIIFLICILILTVLSTSVTVYTIINHSLSMIIVIDPGHGGIDSGTTVGGVLEKKS